MMDNWPPLQFRLGGIFTLRENAHYRLRDKTSHIQNDVHGHKQACSVLPCQGLSSWNVPPWVQPPQCIEVQAILLEREEDVTPYGENGPWLDHSGTRENGP